MPNSRIRIQEPSSTDATKELDAESRSVAGNTVHLERIRVAGSSENYANVNASSELLSHDADVLAQLALILTELGQKLESGGEVVLSAATLSALESVTAAVTGTVTADQGSPRAQTLPGWPIADGEPEPSIVAGTVTASGDTTLVTPALGNRIRLKRVQALDARTDPLPIIRIKLGSTTKLCGYSLSIRQRILGGVNDPLIIHLDSAGEVAYTIFYEEVTP